MDEKKIVPDFGYVSFDGGRPAGLPQPKVVRCGNKNRNLFVKPDDQNRTCSDYGMARKGRMKSNHAPIKVKRTIRTGVRVYQPGESIDWSKAYNSGMSGLTTSTPFISRWS